MECNIPHIQQVPETLWSTKQWELSNMPRITTCNMIFFGPVQFRSGTFRTQNENFTTKLQSFPYSIGFLSNNISIQYKTVLTLLLKLRHDLGKMATAHLAAMVMNLITVSVIPTTHTNVQKS